VRTNRLASALFLVGAAALEAQAPQSVPAAKEPTVKTMRTFETPPGAICQTVAADQKSASDLYYAEANGKCLAFDPKKSRPIAQDKVEIYSIKPDAAFQVDPNAPPGPDPKLCLVAYGKLFQMVVIREGNNLTCAQEPGVILVSRALQQRVAGK
jgi:hypothetical protein